MFQNDQMRENHLVDLHTDSIGVEVVNGQNCNCAGYLMMAETEGIKLDLVILNSQLETGKEI